MKSVNGTEVIAKSYREEDAEEIVSLIIRNLKESRLKQDVTFYYCMRKWGIDKQAK